MLLLRLVLVFCWTGLGAADGNVEIYFDFYLDINLQQSNGDCCRPAAGACLKSCANYFEVCYRPVNTTELFLTCQTTGVLLTAPDPVFTSAHSLSFTLNQTLGNGIRNPISLFFKGSWPVSEF
ncbi:uncharacterized protein LOC134195919 [Corticium candelabrum]|uniref:uncharacterized protein LOC134195919 n=1 Tax=Corticium candelabrum TaxID=121492 RepID=UPI002E26B598|nr:uncharacterized protein LOC134195919 [Corticium candelabrum]